MKIKKGVHEGRNKDFAHHKDVLWHRNMFSIPRTLNLGKELLKHAHGSLLTIDSRSTKMYHDLKTHFWWIGMKKDIADYVARCLSCQKARLSTRNKEAFYNSCLSSMEMWASYNEFYRGSTKNY